MPVVNVDVKVMRLLALLLAVLLTACGSTGVAASAPTASPAPSPSPTPVPTPSPAPSPVTSAHGAITLRTPLTNETLTSPVTISGDASVFEANVQWRITDRSGHVLAQGFATATQGAPGRGAFSASATYTVPAETIAFVEVYSLSPKDGSIDELVRIPVTLR